MGNSLNLKVFSEAFFWEDESRAQDHLGLGFELFDDLVVLRKIRNMIELIVRYTSLKINYFGTNF